MIQYAEIGLVQSRRGALLMPLSAQFAVGEAAWEDLTQKSVRAAWYLGRHLAFELTQDDNGLLVSPDTIVLSPDALPVQVETPSQSSAKFPLWGNVPAYPRYTFRMEVAASGQSPELGIIARWEHQKEGYGGPTSRDLVDSVTLVDSLGQAVTITITSGSALGTTSAITAIGLDTEVIVEWNRVVGATGYALYRDTVPGFLPAPANLIAMPTISGLAIEAYLDTPLVNGTTYYYVVVARAGAIESVASAEASATPQAGAGSAIVDGSGALWVDAQGRGLYTT